MPPQWFQEYQTAQSRASLVEVGLFFAAKLFLMRGILTLLCFLVSLVYGASASATVALDASRVALTGQLFQRIDAGKSLDIEAVSDPLSAEKFLPVLEEIGLEGKGEAVWLRFTVVNPDKTNDRWLLEVEPASISRITLYVPEADGFSVRKAGSALPFTAQEIAYRHPLFVLPVPAGKQQTYYLRLESETRAVVRLTLWQPKAFIEAVGREQMAFGLYLGVYLLLVLASLWFEIAIRDGVYLHFGLYVSACIMTTLTTTGLWQQYILPNHHEWFLAAYSFSLIWMFGACTQFLFKFVDGAKYWPRVTRVFLRVMWAFCGGAFMAVVMGHPGWALDTFFDGMLFVLMPLTIGLLLRPAWRSPVEVRYAFVATGLFLTFSYVCVELVERQVMRPNAFTDNAMYISSMAFFLIVYYAVSHRYNAMRLAKEAAQSEALRLSLLSRRSEHELELLVESRTNELIQAVRTVESALKQAQAMQQEQRNFIATVSHELRTPLAVIDATTQNLVRDSRDSPDKVRARLAKIQHATKRMSLLFDDYLSVDRFEVLSKGVCLQHTPILPLLQDTIGAVQSLTEGHQLSIDCADFGMVVWCDPSLLKLALRTLVDNAVKYTLPKTAIVLRAHKDVTGWNIDVADQGPGIALDDRARIFSRYFRGRASAGRSGSGLGLPLARRVLEMQGGFLVLLAPTGLEGSGSVFRAFLPFPVAKLDSRSS